MLDSPLTPSCLSCGGTEEDKPLISLSYQKAKLAICPQCLPMLIHQPERLAAELGAVHRGQASPDER
jgi:hypothetical protein